MSTTRSSSASASASASAAAVLGILFGSGATLLAVYAAQRLSSKSGSGRNTFEEDEDDVTSTTKGAAPSLPAALREEQLSRHALYFGKKGMADLLASRVLVVGLGGVGSHAAHLLARSGIGHLRMVDFDQVSLSSLNRHAVATLADVGIPKAVCLQRYLRRICPANYCKLEAVCEMYTAESGPRLLDLSSSSSSSTTTDDADDTRSWNMVIDAIDDVPTKAVLIADCLRRRIRVLSCMGAAGKADFTRLHLSDLRSASRDPLASKLRQELRKHMVGDDDAFYLDDMERLAVLYSSEKTVVGLADFTEEQYEESKQQDDGYSNGRNFHQFGAVDGMRIRVLPVLGTTPAIFGQALAAATLTILGGKPFQPVTGERVGRNLKNKTFQHLKRREFLLKKRVLAEAGMDAVPEETGCLVNGTWIGPMAIDQDDLEYLMEIWRNRCAVTGTRLGAVLELVRWDERKPGTCDNLVLMSVSAITKYDEDGGKDKIPDEVRKRIEERLLTCRVD